MVGTFVGQKENVWLEEHCQVEAGASKLEQLPNVNLLRGWGLSDRSTPVPVNAVFSMILCRRSRNTISILRFGIIVDTIRLIIQWLSSIVFFKLSDSSSARLRLPVEAESVAQHHLHGGALGSHCEPDRYRRAMHWNRHRAHRRAEAAQPLGRLANHEIDARLRLRMAKSLLNHGDPEPFRTATEGITVRFRHYIVLPRVESIGPGEHFRQQRSSSTVAVIGPV